MLVSAYESSTCLLYEMLFKNAVTRRPTREHVPSEGIVLLANTTVCVVNDSTTFGRPLRQTGRPVDIVSPAVGPFARDFQTKPCAIIKREYVSDKSLFSEEITHVIPGAGESRLHGKRRGVRRHLTYSGGKLIVLQRSIWSSPSEVCLMSKSRAQAGLRTHCIRLKHGDAQI